MNKIFFLFLVIQVNSCATSRFQQSNGPEERTSISSNNENHAADFHSNIDQTEIDLIDGPYIIGDTLYRINSQNNLIIEYPFRRDSIIVQVDNIYKDRFSISLVNNYEVSKSTFALSEKIAVIADIEGNFNAFSSFLKANKIMDDNHNWIFGKNHLVLLGDFVDRGKNVTQVLWLIYKLEYQARLSNGHVHFILGNHEVMNFQGDHRYNSMKYISSAQKISGNTDKKDAVSYMYSKETELGKWLATKNVIEKIGGYLFVHGGLSPELLDYNLTINDINKLVRSGYRNLPDTTNDTIDFLYGSLGPFWYRGLVSKSSKYTKIGQGALERINSFYNLEKIVIGHTVVANISKDLEGKVIRADVSHGRKKRSGATKGLLIEGGREYIIDDLGSKKEF